MLLEAQTTAFVGATLLLGVFGLAHQRFPSDFSLFWIGGWTFYVIRFLLDILATLWGSNQFLSFGTNVAVATSAILILLAVVHLVESAAAYRREVFLIWTALVGYAALAPLFEFGFLGTYLPLYATFGVIQLVTAYLFYQYLRQYSYVSAPVIVGSLVVWGLHKFNYPVLRPMESLAPYGYVLGAILSVTTGLGVMMFLLEDAERQASAEQAVAERRFEEYEELFNNIPDPVYIHDLEGNFLKVNDTAVDVMGYSRAELLTMTPEDLVAPEYGSKIDERIEQSAKTESITFDSTHVTADGKPIDVSVNAARVTYRGDPAILAVVRNVTQRKVLEQRLSVVNRILRHDIRSAVNIIKGNAEMALNAHGNREDPLTTVIDEADRLHEIGEKAQKIEGLLPTKQSRTEVVDLSLLIESKVLNLRNAYPHASIAADVEPDLLATVSAGFDEAVENLLVNAIVHNDTDEPTVEVEARARDGSVEIRMADDGPGIPEDEVRPIEAGEETALQHTSGLGLWFVHWLVDESGGRLTFEENEPRGTVVTITIPAENPE
jgi:PAS domain S-box-containing protein